MIVIGITGGIGTGKSTAAEYLIEKGFALIDADQIGRDLTAEGEPILAEIEEKFGCVSHDGQKGNGLVLDRKAMADLVFRDNEVKEQFDQMMHQEIISIIDRNIAELKQTDARGILLDAPLLFEANINDRCDVVILITADMDERIDRVSQRDDADEEDIRDRINNQMSDEEKAKYADFVIDNSGEPEDMFAQLDDIIDYLGLE
ncbi:MAG: dephospho-CoA kinase [Clostridiales bacterium]|nr:dephospho-CoA kinase [Clostridiales bacterium]MBQ3321299.1 dephospho-CoA kinase [Bacillota bacterium]